MQRISQHGYTHHALNMLCEFEHEDEQGGKAYSRCTRCTKRTKRRYDIRKPVQATCRVWPRSYEWGHWTALWLGVICIDKRSMRWLVVKLGLEEVGIGCGCEARERWLNTLGGWLFTNKNRWLKALGNLVVRRARIPTPPHGGS